MFAAEQQQNEKGILMYKAPPSLNQALNHRKLSQNQWGFGPNLSTILHVAAVNIRRPYNK